MLSIKMSNISNYLFHDILLFCTYTVYSTAAVAMLHCRAPVVSRRKTCVFNFKVHPQYINTVYFKSHLYHSLASLTLLVGRACGKGKTTSGNSCQHSATTLRF